MIRIHKGVGYIVHAFVICIRPVVPGGAGGTMAPPDFGRLVNPVSTKGGRLKFIYSEKATKFCEISTRDVTVTKLDKSTVEISQKFLAFS